MSSVTIEKKRVNIRSPLRWELVKKKKAWIYCSRFRSASTCRRQRNVALVTCLYYRQQKHGECRENSPYSVV